MDIDQQGINPPTCAEPQVANVSSTIPTSPNTQTNNERPDLIQFCPRLEFSKPYKSQFVEVVRDCLLRCHPHLTPAKLTTALQEGFIPELSMHPEVACRNHIFSFLTEVFAKIGIRIFTSAHRSSHPQSYSFLGWMLASATTSSST